MLNNSNNTIYIQVKYNIIIMVIMTLTKEILNANHGSKVVP